MAKPDPIRRQQDLQIIQGNKIPGGVNSQRLEGGGFTLRTAGEHRRFHGEHRLSGIQVHGSTPPRVKLAEDPNRA